MSKMKIQVIVLFCWFVAIKADYWYDRAALIKLEQQQQIGSSINMTDKEEMANNILMKYKIQEYEKGLKDPSSFLPAQHFFNSREKIENSEVFKIIRMLPKGGSLHGHSVTMVSGEYLYNLTYRENLYACVNVSKEFNNNRLYLHFFLRPVEQRRMTLWSVLTGRQWLNLEKPILPLMIFLKHKLNLQSKTLGKLTQTSMSCGSFSTPL